MSIIKIEDIAFVSFRAPDLDRVEPVRTIHSTPSTNIRLSRPVEPFWSGRPMINPDIRSQSASLNTKRSITPKTASNEQS